MTLLQPYLLLIHYDYCESHILDLSSWYQISGISDMTGKYFLLCDSNYLGEIRSSMLSNCIVNEPVHLQPPTGHLIMLLFMMYSFVLKIKSQ